MSETEIEVRGETRPLRRYGRPMARARARAPQGRKTAKKTAKTPTKPVLRPQPNGRGALYAGGVVGNAGGAGRPPSAIRHALRGGYDERLPLLFAMADGITTLTITERCPKCGHEPPATRRELKDVAVGPDVVLKALDHIGKMGMGVPKGVDVEEIRTKLARTAERLTEDFADVPERMAATLEQLARIWDE